MTKLILSLSLILSLGANCYFLLDRNNPEKKVVAPIPDSQETIISPTDFNKRLIETAVNNPRFLEALCCMHDTRDLFFSAFEEHDCGWIAWEPGFWKDVKHEATLKLLNILNQEWSKLPQEALDHKFQNIEDWETITHKLLYHLGHGLDDEESRFELFYDEKYTKEAYKNSYGGTMTWKDWGDGIHIAHLSYGPTTSEHTSYFAELRNALVQLSKEEREDYYNRTQQRITHQAKINRARWDREKKDQILYSFTSTEPAYLYITQQPSDKILFSGTIDPSNPANVIANNTGIHVSTDQTECLTIHKEGWPIQFKHNMEGAGRFIIEE